MKFGVVGFLVSGSVISFVGCTVLGVLRWQQGAALQREGVQTLARVRNVIEGPKGTHLDYEWTVGDTKYRGSDGGSRDLHVVSGEMIMIKYLPSNPAIAHFDPKRWEDNGKMLVPASILFWTMIGVVFWLSERKNCRVKNAVET